MRFRASYALGLLATIATSRAQPTAITMKNLETKLMGDLPSHLAPNTFITTTMPEEPLANQMIRLVELARRAAEDEDDTCEEDPTTTPTSSAPPSPTPTSSKPPSSTPPSTTKPPSSTAPTTPPSIPPSSPTSVSTIVSTPSITSTIAVTKSATPTSSAPASPPAPSSPPSSTPIPPPSTPAQPPPSSAPPGGILTGACSTEGTWNCDGTAFQRCLYGQWTPPQALSEGMPCGEGMTPDLWGNPGGRQQA